MLFLLLLLYVHATTSKYIATDELKDIISSHPNQCLSSAGRAWYFSQDGVCGDYKCDPPRTLCTISYLAKSSADLTYSCEKIPTRCLALLSSLKRLRFDSPMKDGSFKGLTETKGDKKKTKEKAKTSEVSSKESSSSSSSSEEQQPCNSNVAVLLPSNANSIVVIPLGGCQNAHSKCCDWASKGECHSNPVLMTNLCKQACGTCGCKGESAFLCRPIVNIISCQSPKKLTKCEPGKESKEKTVDSAEVSEEETEATAEDTSTPESVMPELVTDHPKASESTDTLMGVTVTKQVEPEVETAEELNKAVTEEVDMEQTKVDAVNVEEEFEKVVTESSNIEVGSAGGGEVIEKETKQSTVEIDGIVSSDVVEEVVSELPVAEVVSEEVAETDETEETLQTTTSTAKGEPEEPVENEEEDELLETVATDMPGRIGTTKKTVSSLSGEAVPESVQQSKSVPTEIEIHETVSTIPVTADPSDKEGKGIETAATVTINEPSDKAAEKIEAASTIAVAGISDKMAEETQTTLSVEVDEPSDKIAEEIEAASTIEVTELSDKVAEEVETTSTIEVNGPSDKVAEEIETTSTIEINEPSDKVAEEIEAGSTIDVTEPSGKVVEEVETAHPPIENLMLSTVAPVEEKESTSVDFSSPSLPDEPTPESIAEEEIIEELPIGPELGETDLAENGEELVELVEPNGRVTEESIISTPVTTPLPPGSGSTTTAAPVQTYGPPAPPMNTCPDVVITCVFWASTGECSKNPYWMLPNCQSSCKSCGSTVGSVNAPQPKSGCGDSHELCQFWRSIGECMNNEKYMTAKCSLSCDSCNKMVSGPIGTTHIQYK